MDNDDPTNLSQGRNSSRFGRFFREWLAGPLAATVITALLIRFTALPIGSAAFITFVLWPLVGHMMTFDDELPGGWANPDGTEIPWWEMPDFWGRICGHVVIACIAFAIQIDFAAPAVHALLVVALGFTVACVVLIRRSLRPTG